MVPSRQFHIAVLLVLGLAFNSCEDTTVDQVQLVKDIVWRPDGQSLLALAERTSYASASAGTYDAYDLYKVNADGSFGEKIGLPAPVYYGNYFLGILQSSDGSRALVQSGPNVALANITTNSSKIVVEQAYLLGASPDLKYVVTTSDPGYLNKTFNVYDISSVPTRRVSTFNAINSTNNRVLWVSDGKFAVTHLDSNQIGYITLYDTLGVAQRSIENARLPYHASSYSEQTGKLYALDRLNHLVSIDLNTGDRHTIVPTANVESADVSRDGLVAAYTTEDTNQAYLGKVVNVATGDQLDVATGAFIIAVNPDGSKLAYVLLNGAYDHQIKVQNVTLP